MLEVSELSSESEGGAAWVSVEDCGSIRTVLGASGSEDIGRGEDFSTLGGDPWVAGDTAGIGGVLRVTACR